MMKVADKYNDMHLLLYHWAQQSGQYVKFMSRSRVYKILDNSQYELRQEIDYDLLIYYAKKMKVQEIIAPDVMYNCSRTKKLIEDFIPKVPKNMKIQGVACGDSTKSLAECYAWLCDNERIDVIGLSKHGCFINQRTDKKTSDTSYFLSRQYLLSILPMTKPIHLLGVNHFNDFLTPNVRSIDGKFLAKVANHNQEIDLRTKINPSKIQVLFDFFEKIK